MIYITEEQAQQIEEVLTEFPRDLIVWTERTKRQDEAIAIIQAARAQKQAEREPVAEAIAAEARLHRAVRAVASQAGESAEDTIEWLCNGGMAQLFECHFSGKNRESLCEDEGCPHRGVPHICIEKQAEQELVRKWPLMGYGDVAITTGWDDMLVVS